MRAVLVTVLTVLLLAVAPPAVARSGVESSRARVEGVWLDRPVPGRVLAGFHMPTRYGAGHRGVDLHAPNGTLVRASAGGTVTFAGTVVGERWVTVDHGSVRTSVGPLDRIDVRRGAWVGRGAVRWVLRRPA